MKARHGDKTVRRVKRRARLRWLLALCCLLTVVSASSSTASLSSEQSELDTLIRLIETRYGRMRGMAANFEQVYTGAGLRRARRETGRLFLQRPRQMRWEYDPKPGKLFIVNGREVWFYVPADREATHADASTVSDARFPFLFLLGNTSLRRIFRSVTFVDREAGAPADTRTLRLVPRANSSGLRELLLEVFTDGRISKLRMTDQAGSVSEVTLSNVRENFIAPADAFEFHPPPGVTVRKVKE